MFADRANSFRDAGLTALLWAATALCTFALRDGLGAVLLLWVPSGVAVAGFRYTRRRHWPQLVLLLFPVMWVSVMASGIGALPALALAVSASVQSVLCAWLSYRTLGSRLGVPMRTMQVVGLFGGALASCLVGALIAIPFRAEQTMAEFGWWFLANVLGILIATPALLQLRERLTRRGLQALVAVDTEYLLVTIGCAVLCGLALTLQGVALMPLLVAAMVGVAVRYGHNAISTTLLSYVAVATALSLGGENPVHYVEIDRGNAVVLIQSWLLTLLATALPISAMLMKSEALHLQLIRRNAAMHETLMMLDLAEELAGIGRWRLDLRTGAQDWSQRMLELHGLSADLGPDPGDIRHLLPDSGAELFDELEKHVHDREPFQFDYRIKPPEGPERILRISVLNEFDMAGRRTAIFGVAIDVTEQTHREQALELAKSRAVRLAAEAQKLANTDALTQLPNRRCTFSRLQTMVDVAEDTGGKLTALMFDIDHFKAVNDTWGHQTGDEVIVQVAELARRQARQGDVVGRIGGEEFVWLLPGVDANTARMLAERLRAAVENGIEGSALPDVTISVGLAQFANGDDGEDLLARADAALYEAKALGRNQVRRAA
ncbi:sensor domain-containing diguanylate cyclase [Aurantiacibacter luteus]|uniref:diguanylate cyclase n=1 Tax=Aurantiacibacter luteus TaxID=1581420 RepID=A0A0G9MWI1_9SPHN|nr:diguanylate cyclase [Aurantiacibacter luteus]KLE35080.1 hypothetical protein AAW00_00870 [Aurantiacibacter luteus]